VYTLAESLNASLDDMQAQLSGVVDHLNMGSSCDSPLDNITQILNEHLSSLEWIEQTTNEFSGKLALLKEGEGKAWKLQQRVHRQ
jgi:hypothetical protein